MIRKPTMRRLAATVMAISLTGALPVLFARPALAASLCVASKPGCFATLQAAVNAARNGDTITIAPGTYAGGVTIDVSVTIAGAGAGSTVIRGGGPVLTIGTYGASAEPTVSITGVTITGGVARSSPESMPFAGQDGVIARGGGVEIPPNADRTGGATVTISNSVITGNLADPTHALPLGPPCPGGVPCPFAQAAGGGIDNWGTLTLVNTTVSKNRIGSATGLAAVVSDADGGAIANQLGALKVTNSTISGNQASATAPNGRFADSGGMFLDGGSLTMSDSAVTDNRASLTASLPDSVQVNAVAGGVHVTGSVTTAAIRNTTITGNSVSMTNAAGGAIAFSGGLHTDGTFRLSNDDISYNRVYSATLPGSSGNAEGDSGAGEMAGTISNTRFIGNSVMVKSARGTASAAAGAAIFTGTLASSVVSDNAVSASSRHGTVVLVGGGLQSGGPLTLRNTIVIGNRGDANGLTGTAQGGGIFAVDESASGGPPGGPLILINSVITRNSLDGSNGMTLQGGGIFATNPVTLTNTTITNNFPGQCDGC